MKPKKNNHKKAEYIISIWWFVLWAIFIGGLALIVLRFESYTPDTRPQESKILQDLILNCITNNGNLKPEVFSKDYDIEKSCNLNFDVKETKQYQIILNTYKESDCVKSCQDSICNLNCNNPESTLNQGHPGLDNLCTNIKSGNIPSCSDKKIYLLYNNQPTYLQIKIDVGKIQQYVK